MMSYIQIKRLMDIFFAISLGFFLFPVCVITAIAIKLETPNGPVFADTPKRVGRGGKLFYAYKFRSMIPNAHTLLRQDPKFKKFYVNLKRNSFKLYDDPRVTKVGKFIRKYSIDEFPQLINVLIGEMSLIGPRPYYEEELDSQQKKYPNTKQLVRQALSVRPGITGKWQVSGRSQINFDKRIEMDADYACRLSIWYDFEILIRTPLAVISGKGAY